MSGLLRAVENPEAICDETGFQVLPPNLSFRVKDLVCRGTEDSLSCCSVYRKRHLRRGVGDFALNSLAM